jgi:glutaredoxin 3
MVKEQSHKFSFDDQHIGGYDETRALEKENKLLDLLK